MRLDPFQLERYFGQYEFSVPFPLAASDCDGSPLSEVLELADAPTRELWDALRWATPRRRAIPLLREAIAGMYEGCEPDQVLVAAPEELIFIATNCLVRNGDHVVCTFPGYQSLYSVAESLHAEVGHWEPDESARLALRPRPPGRAHPAQHAPDRAELSRTTRPARCPAPPTTSASSRSPSTTASPSSPTRCTGCSSSTEADRLPAAVELYDKAVIAVGRLQDPGAGRPAHRLAHSARRASSCAA